MASVQQMAWARDCNEPANFGALLNAKEFTMREEPTPAKVPKGFDSDFHGFSVTGPALGDSYQIAFDRSGSFDASRGYWLKNGNKKLLYMFDTHLTDPFVTGTNAPQTALKVLDCHGPARELGKTEQDVATFVAAKQNDPGMTLFVSGLFYRVSLADDAHLKIERDVIVDKKWVRQLVGTVSSGTSGESILQFLKGIQTDPSKPIALKVKAEDKFGPLYAALLVLIRKSAPALVASLEKPVPGIAVPGVNAALRKDKSEPSAPKAI